MGYPMEADISANGACGEGGFLHGQMGGSVVFELIAILGKEVTKKTPPS